MTDPSPATTPPTASVITQALRDIRAGDPAAKERLLGLVYDDLKRLAAAAVARNRRQHPGAVSIPLGSTELVAETYLRLADAEGLDFENRRHLFGSAARAMQRVLVDQWRATAALKRGFRMKRVPLDASLAAGSPARPGADEETDAQIDWEWMHTALGALEAIDPREAELVRLRFFAGLTEAQAAAVIGISERQARRDWTHARAWLQARLDESADPPAAQ